MLISSFGKQKYKLDLDLKRFITNYNIITRYLSKLDNNLNLFLLTKDKYSITKFNLNTLVIDLYEKFKNTNKNIKDKESIVYEISQRISQDINFLLKFVSDYDFNESNLIFPEISYFNDLMNSVNNFFNYLNTLDEKILMMISIDKINLNRAYNKIIKNSIIKEYVIQDHYKQNKINKLNKVNINDFKDSINTFEVISSMYNFTRQIPFLDYYLLEDSIENFVDKNDNFDYIFDLIRYLSRLIKNHNLDDEHLPLSSSYNYNDLDEQSRKEKIELSLILNTYKIEIPKIKKLYQDNLNEFMSVFDEKINNKYKKHYYRNHKKINKIYE